MTAVALIPGGINTPGAFFGMQIWEYLIAQPGGEIEDMNDAAIALDLTSDELDAGVSYLKDIGLVTSNEYNGILN